MKKFASLALVAMLAACGSTLEPIGNGDAAADGQSTSDGTGIPVCATNGAVYESNLVYCTSTCGARGVFAACLNGGSQQPTCVCLPERGGSDGGTPTDAMSAADAVTTDASTADAATTDAATDSAPQPQPETCNGQDDDRNGMIDDLPLMLCTETCGSQGVRSVRCEGGGSVCECGVMMMPAPTTCDGQSRPCYTGTTATRGVGACRDGMQRCTGNAWSVCTGQVLPTTEIPGDGLDNDCAGNGDAMVAPTCTTTGMACSAGLGECRREGTYVCTSGATTATCNAPIVTGVAETCNGRDDNCNGQADEGLVPSSCYTGATGTMGVGACRPGTTSCISGAMSACTGQVLPQTEVCGNNIDDNCNGQTDEGCSTCTSTGTTVCGTGACRRTVQTCVGGVMQSCTPGVAVAEICGNGIDDDCDNTVDDGCTSCTTSGSTTCGVGVCIRTVQNCSGGVAQTCTPATPTVSNDATCNGADDDCDGLVDEDCVVSGMGMRFEIIARLPTEFNSIGYASLRDHWFYPVGTSSSGVATFCSETGTHAFQRQTDGSFRCTVTVRQKWFSVAFPAPGTPASADPATYNYAMPRGVRASGATCPGFDIGGSLQITPISSTGVRGATTSLTMTAPSDGVPNEPCRAFDPLGI